MKPLSAIIISILLLCARNVVVSDDQGPSAISINRELEASEYGGCTTVVEKTKLKRPPSWVRRTQYARFSATCPDSKYRNTVTEYELYGENDCDEDTSDCSLSSSTHTIACRVGAVNVQKGCYKRYVTAYLKIYCC